MRGIFPAAAIIFLFIVPGISSAARIAGNTAGTYDILVCDGSCSFRDATNCRRRIFNREREPKAALRQARCVLKKIRESSEWAPGPTPISRESECERNGLRILKC